MYQINYNGETKNLSEDQFNNMMEDLKKNEFNFIAPVSIDIKKENSNFSYNTISSCLNISVPHTTFMGRIKWLFTGRFN